MYKLNDIKMAEVNYDVVNPGWYGPLLDFAFQYGTDGNDTLNGTNGKDVISGKGGDDHIYGGGARDSLFGDAGDDLIYGGGGNDYLVGGTGSDSIYGGADNDKIYGDVTSPFDYGAGDLIDAGSGDDTVYGGRGDDTIDGGSDNDYIEGQLGQDTIVGGSGSDVINGGSGDDELWGDTKPFINDKGNLEFPPPEADLFVYDLNFWGDDRIMDFNDNIDKLDFTNNAAISSFNDPNLTITSDANNNAIVSFHYVSNIAPSGGVVYGGPVDIVSTITLVGQAGNIDASDFLF